MAQQPQTQHRPTMGSPSASFNNTYPQPNGRQFSPQSPPPVSAPSPLSQTSFSPSYNSDAPPAKRPRISPEISTPATSQSVQSPVTGISTNGQPNGISQQSAQRPGTMLPPQYPAIKKESENDFGVLSGIQAAAVASTPLQQQQQQQQRSQHLAPHAPNMRPLPQQQAIQTSFSPAIQSPGPLSAPNGVSPAPTPQLPPIDPAVREQRDHERQDWEEARYSQHELWDPFVFGATLNEKIKQAAARANLSELQNGVLVNTQKNQPPPRVRVQGLEGASKIIDKGQSILNTESKAERLNDLAKLLSLSARARLTGLVQAAARSSLERRAHAQGRIPEDWYDVAAPVVASEGDVAEQPADAAPGSGMKRTHSQANDETASTGKSKSGPHPAISAFIRLSASEDKAERKRQAKRRKRTEISTAQEAEAAEKAEAEAVAAALEAEKKTTKKERKMAESKISDQQQHAHTNEAARMATASLLGRGVGGKKKRYDWMMGGGGSRPASGAATPARAVSTTAVPTAKSAQPPQKARLGDFDDSKDIGIRALDILGILESDGRAARQFVRGSSIMDENTSTSRTADG